MMFFFFYIFFLIMFFFCYFFFFFFFIIFFFSLDRFLIFYNIPSLKGVPFLFTGKMTGNIPLQPTPAILSFEILEFFNRSIIMFNVSCHHTLVGFCSA